MLALTTADTLIAYGFLKDALIEAHMNSFTKQTKQTTHEVQYGFVIVSISSKQKKTSRSNEIQQLRMDNLKNTSLDIVAMVSSQRWSLF